MWKSSWAGTAPEESSADRNKKDIHGALTAGVDVLFGMDRDEGERSRDAARGVKRRFAGRFAGMHGII